MSTHFAIAHSPVVGVTCPGSLFGQHVLKALGHFPVIPYPLTDSRTLPSQLAYVVCGDLLYETLRQSAIQPWVDAAREHRCPILLCLPAASPLIGSVLELLKYQEARRGITDYRVVLAPDVIDAPDMPPSLAPLSHALTRLPDRTVNQLLPGDRPVSPISLACFTREIPRILFSQVLNHRMVRFKTTHPYPAINYYLHLKTACERQTGVPFTLLSSPQFSHEAATEVQADHVLTVAPSFPTEADLRLKLTPVLVPRSTPPPPPPPPSRDGDAKTVRRPHNRRRLSRFLKFPLLLLSLYLAWLVVPLSLAVFLSSSVMVNRLLNNPTACASVSRLSLVLDRLVQAHSATVPAFLSGLPAAESGLRSGREAVMAQCRLSHRFTTLVNDGLSRGFTPSSFSSLKTELEWLHRLTSLSPGLPVPSGALTGGSVLRWSRLSYVVSSLLSQPQPVTLLVVYQDPSELRPSGGLVRALQPLTFSRGNLTVGSRQTPNDVDRFLQGEVVPPADLQGVMGESRWYLRDANWWADVPRSARTLVWFYEKETAQTVQGVILVNSTVDLNFLTDIRTRPLSTLNRLEAMLQGKDIQLWLADASLERFLVDNGWAGEWEGYFCRPSGVAVEPETFALTETNIGLSPIPGNLTRRAAHTIKIDAAGLHHTHDFSLSGDSLSSLFNPYRVYLRWYLPPDSILDGVSLNGQSVPPSQLLRVTENCLDVVGAVATVSASLDVDASIAYSRAVQPESTITGYGIRILKQAGVVAYPVTIGFIPDQPSGSLRVLDESLVADLVRWVELPPGQ